MPIMLIDQLTSHSTSNISNRAMVTTRLPTEASGRRVSNDTSGPTNQTSSTKTRTPTTASARREKSRLRNFCIIFRLATQ